MALLAMLQLLFWFICDYEWCECSSVLLSRVINPGHRWVYGIGVRFQRGLVLNGLI